MARPQLPTLIQTMGRNWRPLYSHWGKPWSLWELSTAQLIARKEAALAMEWERGPPRVMQTFPFRAMEESTVAGICFQRPIKDLKASTRRVVGWYQKVTGSDKRFHWDPPLELKLINLSPESSKETTSLQETGRATFGFEGLYKKSCQTASKNYGKYQDVLLMPSASEESMRHLREMKKKWSSKDDEDHESKAK